MRVRLLRLCSSLPLCAVLACTALTGPEPDVVAGGSALAPVQSAFQASRAWSHLAALAAAPRRTGTAGADRAREYIVGQLAALGLEVREQVVVRSEREEPLRVINVAAAVAGASSDLILLLAPYDSRHYESFDHIGVNDGASGAAVLLELARVIAAEPLPYTTWFVFLDGEALPSSADGTPDPIGSRVFALLLSERAAVEQVRLAVVLNRVCDPDLKIARDLGSHRIYREEFWRAAARLGHADAFQRDGAFESPEASHGPLVRAGLRRVVALVDTSHGGDSPPGPYAGTEDDDLEHCSAESLGVVGRVVLAGLSTIGARLARIDRFADSPVAGAEALRLEDLPGIDDEVEEAETAAVPDTPKAPEEVP